MDLYRQINHNLTMNSAAEYCKILIRHIKISFPVLKHVKTKAKTKSTGISGRNSRASSKKLSSSKMAAPTKTTIDGVVLYDKEYCIRKAKGYRELPPAADRPRKRKIVRTLSDAERNFAYKLYSKNASVLRIHFERRNFDPQFLGLGYDEMAETLYRLDRGESI